MIRPIFLAATAFFLWSCGSKNQQQEASKVQDTTASVRDTAASEPSPYFPVYGYLKSDIQYVDSLPVGIMKYKVAAGKMIDSSYIKLEEFHKLADDFLTSELIDPAFSKTYKESSFFDRSSNTSTFLYKTNDTSAIVKRIDVVTGKGDVYDEVKSIYIEKIETKDNLELVKKLYWKPKRNFQIITVYPESNGKQKSEIIKVVWDNRE
jgi:hypothetical protein